MATTTARAVPGVTGVKLELTFDPPWTKDRMSEAAKLARQGCPSGTVVGADEQTAGYGRQGCTESCRSDQRAIHQNRRQPEADVPRVEREPVKTPAAKA